MSRVDIAFFVLVASVASVAGKSLPWKNRIVGGVDATPGELPFLASVMAGTSALDLSFGKHFCTATILTANWILTAGHCCFSDEDVIQVYVGSVRLSSGGKSHRVERILPHEDFHIGPIGEVVNDICVLRLQEPVTFDVNVQPTVIASKNFNVSDEDPVMVAGWGRTGQSSSIPDNLQKGTDFCVYSLKKCLAEYMIDIDEQYLCAKGRDGQAVWPGDSGGPLLKGNVQIGIVSFGQIWDVNQPAVYTRVSHYIDWLRKTLGKEADEIKMK